MKKNILFILIDNFHAEKCFGETKTSVTPNIDLLIKNGTYFSHAITAAPSTCPSLSSIFTSHYPFESVIRDKKNYVLNPEIENYIANLKNFGYTTYAMVSQSITLYGIVKFFDNVTSYSTNSSVHDGYGDHIIQKLKSNNMDEPWFYYIHLLDLHGYKKFDENEKLKQFHDDSYGINKYEQMVSSLDKWLGELLPNIDFDNTLVIFTSDHGSEDARFSKKLQEYKKNIRTYQPGLLIKSSTKMSKNIPSFLNPLKKSLKQKFLDKRKKILSKKADNEIKTIKNLELSPYDKRIMENAVKATYNVFDDRLKIPLLFVGCNIPQTKIIKNQVRSIDIFPTIAEIIGLTKESSQRGRSLVPLIEGNITDELPAFIESATNHVDTLSENVVGLRTSTFKYFRDKLDSNSNKNLYDLKDDPLEEKNIAFERSDIVEQMEEELLKIKNDGIFENKERNLIDDEDAKLVNEELKKLGYI